MNVKHVTVCCFEAWFSYEVASLKEGLFGDYFRKDDHVYPVHDCIWYGPLNTKTTEIIQNK